MEEQQSGNTANLIGIDAEANKSLPRGRQKLQNKHFWYWLILVVAAVSTAIFIVLNAIQPSDDGTPDLTVRKRQASKVVPEKERIVVAPEGKLPQGFPSWLILFNDVKNISGISKVSDNGTAQMGVVFNADTSPQQVSSLYKDTLTKQGWILDGLQQKGPFTILDLHKDAVLQMIISPQDVGSAVSIKYETKK